LSNFSLVEEDDYKIHYLHYIKSIMTDPQSLRIFTTSWSAPAWMKTTGSIKWGNCNCLSIIRSLPFEKDQINRDGIVARGNKLELVFLRDWILI
jgi:hypothetical protein